MVNPILLIKEVKKYPAIWDLSATVYREINVVANDWQKISDKLGFPCWFIIQVFIQ